MRVFVIGREAGVKDHRDHKECKGPQGSHLQSTRNIVSFCSILRRFDCTTLWLGPKSVLVYHLYVLIQILIDCDGYVLRRREGGREGGGCVLIGCIENRGDG